MTMRAASRVVLGIILVFVANAWAGDESLVELAGADLTGGAQDVFGAVHHGEGRVNYVYARPTGSHSIMRATFTLARVPAEPVFLHLKARDDDGPQACAIGVSINGTSILEGPNSFPADAWKVQRIAIPAGALKVGANELVIANREAEGRLGMPPWFMVARCTIAGQDWVWKRDLAKDFFVTLPAEARPIPEPLPEGVTRPGFAIRGTKGWMWRPEQYLEEIPYLVKFKLNFLMNCYGSMCDVENYAWGDRRCNRWWEPLPEAKARAYEKVVRACRQAGLHYCFSMNPNICTERIVDYDSPQDVETLWKHYAWMQHLGVKWFNISLDDITEGIDASGQARVVNEVFRRLRAADSEAQMIFCPTWYWGDGTGDKQQPYLEILARELHPDVYLFWTGDAVVGRITRRAAESFRGIAKHRLFLWDNYPVNDNFPTMHLAPVTGRDPDLCEVIDGYMSNPMCTQNELNRIPLLTCADYAYNPKAYAPIRSIGQAILNLADTPPQRELLKDLVEAYPGMLIYGKGTSFNAVREEFTRLSSMPHSRYVAELYINHLKDLSQRMARVFPDRYRAARKTLDDDIAWVKQAYEAKYLGE